MKEYVVKVDGKEYLETFNPFVNCVFCDDEGAYQTGKDDVGFCEKCLKESYKGRIKVKNHE